MRVVCAKHSLWYAEITNGCDMLNGKATNCIELVKLFDTCACFYKIVCWCFVFRIKFCRNFEEKKNKFLCWWHFVRTPDNIGQHRTPTRVYGLLHCGLNKQVSVTAAVNLMTFGKHSNARRIEVESSF